MCVFFTFGWYKEKEKKTIAEYFKCSEFRDKWTVSHEFQEPEINA